MITDLSYLKTMAGNDPVFIKEMIGIFKEQIEELSVSMPDHLQKQKYGLLSKAAHKAKSSVAVMGMTMEADLLKELEILADAGRDTDRYGEMIDRFLERSKLAIEELDNIY